MSLKDGAESGTEDGKAVGTEAADEVGPKTVGREEDLKLPVVEVRIGLGFPCVFHWVWKLSTDPSAATVAYDAFAVGAVNGKGEVAAEVGIVSDEVKSDGKEEKDDTFPWIASVSSTMHLLTCTFA